MLLRAIVVCLGLTGLVAHAQSVDGFDVKSSTLEALVGTPVEFVISRPASGAVCAIEIDLGDGNTKKRRFDAKEASFTETYSFSKSGNYKVTVSGATQFKGLNIASPCSGADKSVTLTIREGRAGALDSSNSERRVALVIGNAAYPGAGALKNPANDANDFGAKLKKLGFDVTVRTDIRHKDMLRSLTEFGDKVQSGTEALFFYAGHGMQVKGKNYLIPIDAEIRNEASASSEAVDVDQLLDKLSLARLSVVILDACRNNPFERRFRGSGQGLAQINAPTGTLIAYATAPGKVASDGAGHNGLYTAELLAAMDIPGIKIEDVFKRVRGNVVRKSNDSQTPWESSSLTGDFYFIFQGPTTATIQPAPAADPEAETWAAAESEKTVEGYQTYLDGYPNGRYAHAAKIKLKGLQKPTAAQEKSPIVVASAPPPVPVPVPAPITTTPDDPEGAMWNEVKASGAREYLDAYLKQYPKGKYAALAKIELKKLDDKDKAERAKAAAEQKHATEREKQEALRSEQAAWDEAKSVASVAAYMSYLERYPKGRYAALAQAAQQKVQREATERERQDSARLKQQQDVAEQREETDVWHKAETANDSAAVQVYLDRYPAGRFVAQAKLRLTAEKKTERGGPRPGTVLKDCVECPEMVVIPAGSFDEIYPSRKVTLKSFAMGKTVVTQKQWISVMGNNPSSSTGCGDSCPVEQVTWDEAQEYVQKLSAITGKTYRLPSETEWEYACQAGKKQNYCGSENADDVSWHAGNSGHTIHPTGQKQANAWGLYDMGGNVKEWTENCSTVIWSRTGTSIKLSAQTSACGGTNDGRMVRGGSWDQSAIGNQSTSKLVVNRLIRSDVIGFRVAKTLPNGGEVATTTPMTSMQKVKQTKLVKVLVKEGYYEEVKRGGRWVSMEGVQVWDPIIERVWVDPVYREETVETQ
jgi:uncharacterized caspase-like protein/formylglycine-generating enzyme required for sulfatase activity